MVDSEQHHLALLKHPHTCTLQCASEFTPGWLHRIMKVSLEFVLDASVIPLSTSSVQDHDYQVVEAVIFPW